MHVIFHSDTLLSVFLQLCFLDIKGERENFKRPHQMLHIAATLAPVEKVIWNLLFVV